MEKKKYLDKIKELSDKIVIAQKDIRILDAIKWGDDVKNKFLKQKVKSNPVMNQDYYKSNALKFSPETKKNEFKDIITNINSKLGTNNDVAVLMKKMCKEYILVIEMLEARGSKKFSEYSQRLYGSSKERLYTKAPSIKDLSKLVINTLTYLKNHPLNKIEKKQYSTSQAVEILNNELHEYFTADRHKITVKISDNIVSDAAAGSEYIKLKKGVKFSRKDLEVLKVHEGWVHLATTLNGKKQPYCTFLSKGTPSTTVIQEGLAVIMEIFAFVSHPERMLGLSNRVHGINMSENGADFIEVFRYFQSQGHDDSESYNRAMRIFRGSLPTLGPYTKDLAYNKGFILIYNFIRLSIKNLDLDKIPLLFLGKISLDNIPALSNLVDDGVIVPPKYVPPQFSDLSALSSWMCYSLFLNKFNLDEVSKDVLY